MSRGLVVGVGVERDDGDGHAPSILAGRAGRYWGPLLSMVVVVTALLLIARLPAVMSTTWTAIVLVFRDVSPIVLLGLTAVWLLGLLAQTVVQSAALPGLSARRALLLNLTGSAVSSLLPFGGAAGVGMGLMLTRRWQIPGDRFSAYTAITNLWNAVAKVLAGAVVVAVAVVLGLDLPPGLRGSLLTGTVVALGLGGVLAGGAALVLRHPWIAARLGAQRLRTTTLDVVSRGWGQLCLGVVVYLVLQAILLGLCLAAVGAHVPWTAVAVAFAVERMLTLIPITPGGAGFAELGAVGVLCALNAEPVTATAGVLLFRLFTFFLEIPVGGVSALVWMRVTRARFPVAASPVAAQA